MKVSNPVVINALLAKNAEVEGAVYNAFDELTIKKDGRYWRIYQGSNDAGMRVFDNPESAKKFIKEKWGDGWKIRVKNAEVETVASNAFKNTRLVPALENEVGELPDKMNRVVKKLKGDFSFWLQRDFIDGVESLIRTIDTAISSGEGDESEVKALKAMKPKLEKYRADAKSVMSKVNAI